MSDKTNDLFSINILEYEQALSALEDDRRMLLATLVTRDQVEYALQQFKPFSVEQTQQLVILDARLRKLVNYPILWNLPTWRQTVHPPDTHWWWFLEQQDKSEAEKAWERPWKLLIVILLIFTIPFALEIIIPLLNRRLDPILILIPLLPWLLTWLLATLYLSYLSTVNEFIVNIVNTFFLRKTFINNKRLIIIYINFFIFIFILILPILYLYDTDANTYNLRGVDALQEGNFSTAQRNFQRAVALDPGMVISYYNLAILHEEIGQLEEAITWYQHTIEHDLNFGEAYNNQGRLHILLEEPELAVQVLQAGLRAIDRESDTESFMRYKLLSNLGWAYYVLEEPMRAHEVLEQAVALESELDADNKSAVPHYYLALIYEALERPDAAIQQWEDSLRYLDSTNPDQWGWQETIRQRLSQLEEDGP